MGSKKGTYIKLEDLEVYQLARRLSSVAWGVYVDFSFEKKKIIGDQFIRSVDSVGANIAEGYGRFHIRDKVRFYFIARASLSEAIAHWAELMREREIIEESTYCRLIEIHKPLQIKLNNLISSAMKSITKS